MNSPHPVDTANARVVESVTKARFSTSEFLQMSEAGAFADMKIELVDGELERMTPPGNAHSGRQGDIYADLRAILGKALVRVEIGIVLDDDTVLGCDVAVLCAPVTESRMMKAADLALVIEVAETTVARDMNMKRAKYASANIPTYWVIDGTRSVVHIFAEPVAGDYASISTVRFGAPLALPGSERTITID